MKRVGFYRELAGGSPNDPSLFDAPSSTRSRGASEPESPAQTPTTPFTCA